jgi:hypothetical protein
VQKESGFAAELCQAHPVDAADRTAIARQPFIALVWKGGHRLVPSPVWPVDARSVSLFGLEARFFAPARDGTQQPRAGAVEGWPAR